MNSPLKLIEDKFPIEVLNIIQSYMSNDVVYFALQKYFDYLFYKRDLYQEFVLEQYIEPNCRCFSYWNSIAQRWKTRDCYFCEEFEYSDKYTPLDFTYCITENDQYDKIMYSNTFYKEY